MPIVSCETQGHLLITHGGLSYESYVPIVSGETQGHLLITHGGLSYESYVPIVSGETPSLRDPYLLRIDRKVYFKKGFFSKSRLIQVLRKPEVSISLRMWALVNESVWKAYRPSIKYAGGRPLLPPI